jgi:chemotaxis protein methyltransferase CheR
MSEKDFQRCSRFIQEEYGIKMPPSKKTLLECRLRKRMRILSMDSFEKYVEYAFREESGHDELIHMIDVVTTNKTDFFRESQQFDYLASRVLPEVAATLRAGVRRPLARGVYKEERTDAIPERIKKKYLLRSKDRSRETVRIVPELRGKVSFHRLNFMEETFGLRDHMDVIFCRNVIIYFEKETQERLVNQLCTHLLKDGFLFVGHSETLHGMTVPLVQAAPMVYRKAH